MTYGLTPSFTEYLVLRCYKHFDRLHERLVDKFGTVIAIPPLAWKHFIEEEDEKKWTEGKRKSEEDTNIRCAFLTHIQHSQ